MLSSKMINNEVTFFWRKKVPVYYYNNSLGAKVSISNPAKIVHPK